MTSTEPSGHNLGYSVKGFLRRSASAATIRLAGILCVFGLQVLLARLLGDTEEYGKYAWGQTLLFMVGMLACIGLPVITNRFIASLSALQNESAIMAVIHRARTLLLRSSSIVLLIAGIVMLLWPKAAAGEGYRELAILALLLAPGVTFLTLYKDICRARQWLVLALLPMQVLRPIVTAALAIACWYALGNKLSGAFALGLAGLSMYIVLLPQVFLYHRGQNHLSGSTLTSSAEYSPEQLLPTALPVFVTRIAGLTVTYSNVLLLGVLVGPGAAGTYFAAERLASLATIPKLMVSQVNQQSMAASYATGNRRELQLLAVQSAHGSLWPTLVASIVLFVFGDDVLQIFGAEYASDYAVLCLLAVGAIMNVIAGPAQDILIMTGGQKSIPPVMIAAAALHIAVICILVPLYGAIGAALATISSAILAQFWLMRLAKKHVNISTTIFGKLAD
ncbi:MAG: O-antigen/teichoic acid export membrane protein [Halioglobus sp.]|jgi:O-antigen/teichoic acid export membrane protein